MDVPSSLTSLVMAAPALPASAWMAAALIVPLTSISMWKDVTADFAIDGCRDDRIGVVGVRGRGRGRWPPDEPRHRPWMSGLLRCCNALAMTTTSPASTERAGLGTRNTIWTST